MAGRTTGSAAGVCHVATFCNLLPHFHRLVSCCRSRRGTRGSLERSGKQPPADDLLVQPVVMLLHVAPAQIHRRLFVARFAFTEAPFTPSYVGERIQVETSSRHYHHLVFCALF